MQRYTQEEKEEKVKRFDALRASGKPYKGALAEVGVSGNTLATWRTKVAPAREVKGFSIADPKLLKIENQRLKNIVAEQALDIQALKEYCGRG